jgi:hypothetical protein
LDYQKMMFGTDRWVGGWAKRHRKSIPCESFPLIEIDRLVRAITCK